MFLARVLGNVVATVKHPRLAAQKLLWIRRMSPDGALSGPALVALDSVDAGPGDPVLVLDEGNGAAQILARPRGPVRTIIVGVVDAVDVAGAAPDPPGPEPTRLDRRGKDA